MTHTRTHSRACTKKSNPSLDPDGYPSDGKPMPKEPIDIQEHVDKENGNPNIGIDPNCAYPNNAFINARGSIDARANAPDLTENMKQMLSSFA